MRKNQIKVDVATMVRRDDQGVPVGTLSVTRLAEAQDMMNILRTAAYLFREDSTKGARS